MKHLLFFLAGLTLALVAAADNLRLWEQQGYEELDKGTPQRLSLRNDGKLMLAPQFSRVGDPGLNYIWALAEDSRGNVYVGGGSPAKVVRVAPGKPAPEGAAKSAERKLETVFEVKELEIHALAVDADDNLYAATSPDPKIYKITREGKSSVFFEPKAKYVWALAFDPRGNLLVATGDKGELYRVDRSGQGKLFFNSDETHIRAIALDRAGNVIIGTDPSGLIVRISPAGEGFVLHQAAKKEVTAVEVGPDGSIYAAAVGDKQQRPPTPALPVPPVPPQVVVGLPPAMPSLPPVAGGSEVYRIFPDGAPRRLWSSKEEVVYSLAVRGQDKLLVGTGNKGKIFQLEPEGLHTSLLRAQASQVTAFLRRRNGALYAATSNIGRLQEVGSAYEAEGLFESEVFDARHFARWGRVYWSAETPAGTAVSLFTRSGNADNPDRNWSPWTSVGNSRPIDKAGAASSSPGARFLQWKAVLTSANGQSTPWLDTVRVAYFPKNLKPVIEEVEATPQGYRFQQNPAPPSQPPPAVTLPPLGQSRQQQPQSSIPRFEPPAQLLPQKGAQGVRWAAHDENDDTLIYSVYIRGKDERTWKLLKDKLTDKFYWWDSTAFPDGVYYVKIVASDAPSNAEQDALTDERQSAPFEVDNTPPQIIGLKATVEGGKLRVSFRAVDALSPIKKAEYSINGSEWRLVLPVDQLSDSLQEEYNFLIPESSPGEHTIAVRVQDRVENLAVEKIVVR